MTGTHFNLHKFVRPFPKDTLGTSTFLDQDVAENENYPFPQYNEYCALKNLLKEGKKDEAKYLIEKGCPLNRDLPDHTYDGTPLHLAVSLEYSDIVELLLEKGASVNSDNDNDETPLMLAAIVGNSQITDMILAKTEPKKSPNREVFSHFHIACMRNNVDLVQKFLVSGEDINKPVEKVSMFWPGFTPLHFAVEFKSIETAKLLIEKGADITIQDSRGLTPLHLAFRKRNRLLTDLLLSKQYYYANNPVDADGLSHFHIACAFNDRGVVEDLVNKKIEVKHYLFNNEFQAWACYSSFRFAIANQCINVLKYLLKGDTMSVIKDKTNLITHAYETRNLKIVNLVISSIEKAISNAHSPQVFKDLSSEEETAIDESTKIKFSHMKTFSVSEYSELHVAVLQKNNTQVSSILKGHHPSIITVPDARGKTPLHLAFETNQKDLVDQLLSLHLELNENPVDNNNLSHFHISCITVNESIVEDFIQKGADINMPINLDSPIWAGNTPLHLAIIHCNVDVAQLLINYGADYTLKNALGLSAYDLALPDLHDELLIDRHDEDHENWEFVKQILMADEDRKLDNFDCRVITLLHIASANGDIDMINRYMSDDTRNKTVNHNLRWWWSGFTPLHFAAQFDQKNAMKILLDNGADPSIENRFKNTAAHLLYTGGEDDRMFLLPKVVYNDARISIFHVACRCGNPRGVQHFLNMGVDVRERVPNNCDIGVHTLEGETPLHLAVAANNPEIVKLLLEHGADVNARDCNFNTPLHSCGNKEVLKIMLDHGADPEALDCDLHNAMESAFFRYSLGYSEQDDFMSAVIESGWDINKGRLDLKHNFESSENIDVLVRLIERLTVLGFSTNKQYRDIYESEIENFLYRYEMLIYKKRCVEESNLMKGIEIDSRTTLYDVLFKSSNEMVKYSKNEALRKFVESEQDLRQKYPIYAYLVILQYKKGVKRTVLLEEGKKSLSILMNGWMGDLVFEMILQFMNDHDITYLNYATTGQNIFQ